MYLNVICLKCGKTIPFQSVYPYSVDKVVEGWNLISDDSNGQIISVRGSEIASICSQDTKNVASEKTAARVKKAAAIQSEKGEKADAFNVALGKKKK